MENKLELTDTEITNHLRNLDGWSRENQYIKKCFIFSSYKEINKFLPYLTKTIVTQNHHPDFSFDSGRKSVTIQVTTHSAKRITKSDIDLADALNRWSEGND